MDLRSYARQGLDIIPTVHEGAAVRQMEKRGIVHNEILLPANAPPEYADRNTLWNAAEAVEKQWNSQLARRWVLTIPREIPPDQYAVLVREFCEQQFVSKGMIADFAIHDPHPPGHNPHAHVLLLSLIHI